MKYVGLPSSAGLASPVPAASHLAARGKSSFSEACPHTGKLIRFARMQSPAPVSHRRRTNATAVVTGERAMVTGEVSGQGRPWGRAVFFLGGKGEAACYENRGCLARRFDSVSIDVARCGRFRGLAVTFSEHQPQSPAGRLSSSSLGPAMKHIETLS